MAGSFVSPSGPTTKMKHGKANRPKRSADVAPNPFGEAASDPHRHGSEAIPNFASRRAHTNNKSGFNTSPAHPPAGRLAQRSDWYKDRCASGRVVGKDDKHREAANSRGSKGTRTLNKFNS